MLSGNSLSQYFVNQEPLLRLAAARIGGGLNDKDRLEYLPKLLGDQYRAIRIAAARSLLVAGSDITSHASFRKAFSELLSFNDVNAWRGEGRLNQAMMHLSNQNESKAEVALLSAIDIDPYFEAAYVNLASLYQLQLKEELVAQVLLKGLKNVTQSHNILYSMGLHQVRIKNIDAAIRLFSQSMQLALEISRYTYTYVLALDTSGRSEEALAILKSVILNYQDKAQLKELGRYLSKKVNNKAEFIWFSNL